MLRKVYRLKECENRVLRRIFGLKRDEVTGNGESYRIKSFIICTHPQISIGRSNSGERIWRVMWQPWRGEKIVQGFCEKAQRKEPLENRGLNGRMESQWILGRLPESLWSGFIWIRTGTDGGLLLGL
jgi:hypothetical protein